MHIALILKIETITYPGRSTAGSSSPSSTRACWPGSVITVARDEPNKAVRHGKGGAME